MPHRLLPEGGAEARPVEVFVAAPNVIYEKIQSPKFLLNAGEQGFDFGIHCVVAANGDPLPTSLRDRIRSVEGRAGKTFRRPARITASGDIDGRARFPEGESDALADAATGPSDNRDSSAQR
jgi:hypothetical protein